MTPQEIINQTNTYRKSQGLPALKDDPQLTKAATDAAKDMVSKGYFSHVSSDGKNPWDWIKGSGYPYSYSGQNLAKDFSSATDTLAAWKASPNHNKNLLSKNYQDVGVAVVGNTIVQMFGSKEKYDITLKPKLDVTLKSKSIPDVSSYTKGAFPVPTQTDNRMSQTTLSTNK